MDNAYFVRFAEARLSAEGKFLEPRFPFKTMPIGFLGFQINEEFKIPAIEFLTKAHDAEYGKDIIQSNFVYFDIKDGVITFYANERDFPAQSKANLPDMLAILTSEARTHGLRCDGTIHHEAEIIDYDMVLAEYFEDRLVRERLRVPEDKSTWNVGEPRFLGFYLDMDGNYPAVASLAKNARSVEPDFIHFVCQDCNVTFYAPTEGINEMSKPHIPEVVSLLADECRQMGLLSDGVVHDAVELFGPDEEIAASIGCKPELPKLTRGGINDAREPEAEMAPTGYRLH